MAIMQFAHMNGMKATQILSREEQKTLGQFMTPPGVAGFMAQRCLPQEKMKVVRVLDPAAGAGILAAAVVEALLNHKDPPAKISVMLYELDHRLIPLLRLLAEKMRTAAKQNRVELSVSIRQGDFLLSSVAIAQQPIADIIIANPPYFKVNASDPRAKAHSYAVYGQPNIYGLFMAACAGLLAASGRWCFITPRSWTNGMYFEAMRRHVFRCLHIDAMHVFESRRDHFTEDEILQEAMITWATTKEYAPADIVVSTSAGSRDIAEARLLRLPFCQIVGQDEAQMIVLPNDNDAAGMSGWSSTLSTYGFKVSTGPVVAFRASDFISETPSDKSVPLLWMQHITHMKVMWPSNVYLFTVEQSEKVLDEDRMAWLATANKPGYRTPGIRWYADNSREPIRDDLMRNQLWRLGIMHKRPGFATTASTPINYLSLDFASLFDPTLGGEELGEAVEQWRIKHLDQATLQRMALRAQGIAATEGDIFIDMPDNTRIRISAGPSSDIVKGLIEDFAARHLQKPSVLWISASDQKTHPQFVQLAEAVGLRFDPSKELPDIIFADLADKPMFLFCEVVASDGAVTEARKNALLELIEVSDVPAEAVRFLTAFEDRQSPTFRKNFSQLALNSLVWFRTEPDLLVILSTANKAALDLEIRI